MSADNGIYIGCFPIENGSIEYRVIHDQAIDNVNYGSKLEQDAFRFLYFGEKHVFQTLDKDAAMAEAHRIEEEILNDDYCRVLEYGITTLVFDRPLIMMSVEKANEILNA